MRTIASVFKADIDLSIFAPYRIDCETCCGLCCVALYFTKSDGFPHNKEAGTPCKNLRTDGKCRIYGELSQNGLKGCMTYDCFGAGQFITRRLKSLPDWQNSSQKETSEIFNSYLTVLGVHQTLWYVTQCLILRLPQSLVDQGKTIIQEGNSLIQQPTDSLAALNTQPFCGKANEYLKQICAIHHNGFADSGKKQSKNYMGQNMQGKNLEGRDFSMSLLIAANLTKANLHGANFLGADMRDANLSDTDLRQCLFLTQIQINSANGNHKTLLPPYIRRPILWG